jgi:hypothetical protein
LSLPTLPGRARQLVIHAAGILLVSVGVLGVTVGYVLAEHTFYTWDFHEYSTRLETTYAQLNQSVLTGLVQVYLSTSQDYNLIPTLPLLPLRGILDASRLAYEANLAVVFIVPFVLAVGWAGSRTIRGPRTTVLWSTVLIALAIPYTWVSILRGFADLGAAAMVAIGIGLYLGDPRLTRLWRPLAIGALVAGAFLFRRPFAYDGIAFGAALGVMVIGRALAGVRGDLRQKLRALVIGMSRVALVVLGGVLTLLAIGHRLVGKVLIEDYGALYRSYVRDPADVLGWLGSGFGWLIVGLAGAGFVLSRRAGMLDGRLLFVGLYGLFLTAVWALVVGQEDVHYAAHFVLPVAIGLAALAWALQRLLPPRLAAPGLAAVVLLLGLNLAAGLTPWVPADASMTRSLLSAPNPPLVRGDYQEMLRLVAAIREAAGTSEAVLVIGSTDGFSDDTIRIADDVSRGTDDTLFVLNSPHVDSRDQYPLAVLLAADVVVLPDPLPLPLAPEHQGVQRVLHDLFLQGSAVSNAFRLLPGSYAVEGGIDVHLLARVRPTSLPEAVAALMTMRRYTPVVPPNQVPWVSVGGLEAPITDVSGNRPPVIIAGRDSHGIWVANSLIYVGADAATTIRGSAEFLDRTCAGIDLGLSSIDGILPASAPTTYHLAPDEATTFTITNPGDGAGDLLFAPSQRDSSRPCPARIDLDGVETDRGAARSLLIQDQGAGTTR